MTLTTIFLIFVGIYAIYVFFNMRMKKYGLALCVLGVIGCVWGINRLETRNQRLTNQKFEFLYANGQFAPGKVLYFGKLTSSNNSSNRTSIHYVFEIDSGIRYESAMGTLLPDFFDNAEKKYWRLAFEKAQKNDSFCVLYNPVKPDESILLLDKPIIKSSDFEKYVKEFEKLRDSK